MLQFLVSTASRATPVWLIFVSLVYPICYLHSGWMEYEWFLALCVLWKIVCVTIPVITLSSEVMLSNLVVEVHPVRAHTVFRDPSKSLCWNSLSCSYLSAHSSFLDLPKSSLSPQLREIGGICLGSPSLVHCLEITIW